MSAVRLNFIGRSDLIASYAWLRLHLFLMRVECTPDHDAEVRIEAIRRAMREDEGGR